MPYTWSQLLGIGRNTRPVASEQGGQGKAAGGAAQYQIGESGLEVTTGRNYPGDTRRVKQIRGVATTCAGGEVAGLPHQHQALHGAPSRRLQDDEVDAGARRPAVVVDAVPED